MNKRRTVNIQIVDNTFEITDLNHNQIASFNLKQGNADTLLDIGSKLFNYLLTSEDGKRKVK